MACYAIGNRILACLRRETGYICMYVCMYVCKRRIPSMLPQTPHLLLHLLAATTSAIGVPNCEHPAPPPASLPTIADCHRLLRLIAVVARLQHDTPLTWSRDPPQTAGQQLPAYFSSGSGNECEFVVDVDGGAGEEAADVFPTGDVVGVGWDNLLTCLVGAAGSVGSCFLGPR